MAIQFNKLRLVIGQLNFLVGDIVGNAHKIIEQAIIARTHHKADLFVLPELALTGYPPEDLLFRDDFHEQIAAAISHIAEQTQGIELIIGYPHKIEQTIYNAAVHLKSGKIIASYHKHHLPNYGVFDEKRYFTSGTNPGIIECQGIKIGLAICEDIWFKEPIRQAKLAGAELIVSINASPFELQKEKNRAEIIQQRIAENQLAIVYAHGVGGQDEIVFDGGSCVFNQEGELCCQAPYFKEALLSIEVTAVNRKIQITKQALPKALSTEELAYQALVLGVKDYIGKNYFPGVLIGSSGGIDSALTIAIAVDALGADKVHTVSLPSRYTSQLSLDLAQEIADLTQVKHSTISIEPMVHSFTQGLAQEFANYTPDQTEENIQARCRGLILMALSNKTGKLVLTTGNKSEMAVGYATLYGDMAGGFAVLKDVFKTLVYQLANHRNQLNYIIPQAIIDRPPTAELKADQTDQDTLPPYPILDKILQLYIEEDKSPADIISHGFSYEMVKRVIKMVDKNEYKRRQAPPGIRITKRAFGRDRRYPITNGFKHHE